MQKGDAMTVQSKRYGTQLTAVSNSNDKTPFIHVCMRPWTVTKFFSKEIMNIKFF